jgi:hypothetical protein
MTKYSAVSAALSRLTSALDAAGMQGKAGTDRNKPYYFRLRIPQNHANDKAVLRYQLLSTDPISADNDWNYIGVYVAAVLFVSTADGVPDAYVNALMSAIEASCDAADIGVKVGSEAGESISGDATGNTGTVNLEFLIRVVNSGT